MRNALVLIFVAGCAGSPGPEGPPGPAGERGAVGAVGDTAVLVAEVAALRGEVERLRTARPKSLRLVVRETGEDLGPFVDWDHVYSEQLGAAYRRSINGTLAVYASDDCTGDVFLSVSTFDDDYISDREGRIMRIMSAPTTVRTRSYRDVGECFRADRSGMAAPAIATGIQAIALARGALSVTYR